jgi:hypothetical protein
MRLPTPSLVRSIFSTTALFLCAATTAHGQWVNTGSIASSNDPVWSVRWRGINGALVTPGFASNASTLTSFPSVWNPNLSDTRWIAASPSGSVSVSGGTNSVARVEYLFQTTFTPTTNGVVGRLAWDNLFMGAFIGGTIDAGGQLVGGTRVLDAFTASPGQGLFGFCRDGDGFLPGSSYPNCTMSFVIRGLTIGQSTTVTFVLNGDGGTDGLFMTGANVMLPEPTSLILTGTGLLGLAGLARRMRRT